MTRNEAPYHHGNLRETLLDRAEELLARDGVNKLSLRAVAKAAGVSHNAPYRHFEDKAALLRGIGQRGFEAQEQAMLVVLDQGGNIGDRVVEAGVAYVRLALGHPERMRLMFGGSLEGVADDRDYIRTSERAFAGLMQVIDSGVAEQAFVGDPRVLALSVWSTVHGFSLLVLAGAALQEEDTEARLSLARAMATNIVRGFSAESSSAH